MAQRQFRSDDTVTWNEKFGSGTDGDLTISSNTTESPIDSACTGTAGQTNLTATNASFAAGQTLLIHQTRGTGAGNWELNKIVSYSAGTITLSYPLINTYGSGAQVRVLKQYNDVTVNSAKTWTSKAWNGTVGGILAFLANGTVTVTGTISANGKGYRGGAVASGDPVIGYSGEGTAGASVQQKTANGSGGGAGRHSGSNYGSGGGGGHASSGTAGDDEDAGSGGNSAGNAGLTTMVPGGGGGGMGHWEASASTGGDGGGIVLIIAKTITVTGAISTHGGNGAYFAFEGGMGGGAGGPILLKGQALTLGTNLLTATKGNGATGTSGNGGDGSAGRIHADYKDSVSGTTNPTLDSTQDATLMDVMGGAFLFNMV